MKKVFIDTELSARYGPCYAINAAIINKDWLSHIIYFDVVIILMAEMNTLPTSLVKIEEYPISEIIDLKVTELSVADPLETKLRSILYCIENDILFSAKESDSNSGRELLINKAGEYIYESINFLKKSFLTIDVIKFVLFEHVNVEGDLSEFLVKIITDYKSSEHISNLRNGIDKIVMSNDGNYYLTAEIKNNIQLKLSEGLFKILDLLDFDEITSFKMKSLLSDGASIVGGFLSPFLPLSTIQEIYTYFKINNKASSDSDILFVLSVMYLKKAMHEKSNNATKKQCQLCKLTSVEIDNIGDSDVHDFIFKSTANLCYKHLRLYLDLRKFHGLMGKALLRHLIASK
ncbi:hypothetical protein [Shewanella sp.]|uniref:hypothetical protein n=1 Tax=Shewanella sp. TaxID=50422 RepID=UPI00356987D4